jgi:teichuronic acid biosynthesis glycosyltransferase TuaH
MLADELVRYARLLWVDPEKSVVTRARYRQGDRRRVLPYLGPETDSITRLAPVVLPFHSRVGVRNTTPMVVRSQIRWALRELRTRPYAVLDSRLSRLLGGWGPGVRNVLFGRDDYVAGATLMGRDVSRVERDEREALEQADLVFAISDQLAERWRAMGAAVTVIPNGVQASAYATVDEAELPAGVDLPAPVVGVVGHLSDRIDLNLLEAVADRGYSLLLVGSRDPHWQPERFSRLTARERVRWVGAQPFEALPGYLRLIDVGITPYQDTPFNRASFPLKTLEYLAAGRPVVSTDLPATRWLGTDLVRIAADSSSFVAAVEQAAAEARRPDLVAARRAFAAEHSWRSRADQLAEALGLAAAVQPGT